MIGTQYLPLTNLVFAEDVGPVGKVDEAGPSGWGGVFVSGAVRRCRRLLGGRFDEGGHDMANGPRC